MRILAEVRSLYSSSFQGLRIPLPCSRVTWAVTPAQQIPCFGRRTRGPHVLFADFSLSPGTRAATRPTFSPRTNPANQVSRFWADLRCSLPNGTRCEEIIKNYPNTLAATQAKELLEKLAK